MFWDPDDHPRDDDGKFTSGGGGSTGIVNAFGQPIRVAMPKFTPTRMINARTGADMLKSASASTYKPGSVGRIVNAFGKPIRGF